jgi:hypothetical protein
MEQVYYKSDGVKRVLHPIKTKYLHLEKNEKTQPNNIKNQTNTNSI